MTADQVETKVQRKRRTDFKSHALKIFSTYNERKLISAVKIADKSGYKEWKKDYHALISQGKIIKRLSDNEFRVFIMAVYGWMPVLYSQQNIKKLKKNIPILLSSKSPDKKIITETMECFKSRKHKNGSISALSKVLHFCRPVRFPVWDTRVAKSLGRESGTGNNVDIYLDYLFVMSKLKFNKDLANYYMDYKNAVDNEAVKIRALEHGLFLHGLK